MEKIKNLSDERTKRTKNNLKKWKQSNQSNQSNQPFIIKQRFQTKQSNNQSNNENNHHETSSSINRSYLDNRCKYWIDSRLSTIINSNTLFSRGINSIKIDEDYSAGGKSFLFQVSGETVAKFTDQGILYCRNAFINGYDLANVLNIFYNENEAFKSQYVRHVDLKNGTYKLNVKDIITDTLASTTIMTNSITCDGTGSFKNVEIVDDEKNKVYEKIQYEGTFGTNDYVRMTFKDNTKQGFIDYTKDTQVYRFKIYVDGGTGILTINENGVEIDGDLDLHDDVYVWTALYSDYIYSARDSSVSIGVYGNNLLNIYSSYIETSLPIRCNNDGYFNRFYMMNNNMTANSQQNFIMFGKSYSDHATIGYKYVSSQSDDNTILIGTNVNNSMLAINRTLTKLTSAAIEQSTNATNMYYLIGRDTTSNYFKINWKQDYVDNPTIFSKAEGGVIYNLMTLMKDLIQSEVPMTIINPTTTNETWQKVLNLWAPNLAAGGSLQMRLGVNNSTRNEAQLCFVYAGNGDTTNHLDFAIEGTGGIMDIYYDKVYVGKATTIKANLTVNGTITSDNTTADEIMLLNSAGGNKWIDLGVNTTAKNLCAFGFRYSGSGSDSNRAVVWLNGDVMSWYPNSCTCHKSLTANSNLSVVGTYNQDFTLSGSSTWFHIHKVFCNNLSGGKAVSMMIGKNDSNGNCGIVAWHHTTDGNSGNVNYLDLCIQGTGNLYRFYGNVFKCGKPLEVSGTIKGDDTLTISKPTTASSNLGVFVAPQLANNTVVNLVVGREIRTKNCFLFEYDHVGYDSTSNYGKITIYGGSAQVLVNQSSIGLNGNTDISGNLTATGSASITGSCNSMNGLLYNGVRVMNSTDAATLYTNTPDSAHGMGGNTPTNAWTMFVYKSSVARGFGIACAKDSSSSGLRVYWNRYNGGQQGMLDNQYSTITTDYGSDRRLKTYIQPITNDIIDKLEPVSFYYKNELEQAMIDCPDATEEDEMINESGCKIGKHFGLIAQDVQKICPELVYGKETEDDHLSIHYIELIPHLIRKVQQQQHIIDALTERLDRLEKLVQK